MFYNDFPNFKFSDEASGNSIDWAYSKLNSNYALAYEVRPGPPTGFQYGFALPPDQIIENSEEVFASIIAEIEKSELLGIS
jgi:hypothetical protein